MNTNSLDSGAVKKLVVVATVLLTIVCTVTCASSLEDSGPGREISKPEVGAQKRRENKSSLDELRTLIAKFMADNHVPGLAAGIVKDGKLAWGEGFGWADVDRGVPITTDTIFAIASISKTVTGTALMQLWDQGRFDLDEDVATYLRFPLSIPAAPNQAVTFRHLLTHTSSIIDNEEVYESSYGPGDPSVLLSTYVNSYLVPAGQRFDREENFLRSAPGTEYEYSNIAFGLIGHLVEEMAYLPFELATQKSLFQPLGMSSTGWHLKGRDPKRLVVPYEWDEEDRKLRALTQYGFPTYPDGGLRTTIHDFSRFMLLHLQSGNFDGHELLSAAASQLMATVFFKRIAPEQGLAFQLPESGVLAHSGGDPGVSTEMVLMTEIGLGVVVFANRGVDLESLLPALIECGKRL